MLIDGKNSAGKAIGEEESGKIKKSVPASSTALKAASTLRLLSFCP